MYAHLQVFYVWDLPRGGFIVKLMKLKLEGPSIARAPFRALGETLVKYSFSYLNLYLRFYIPFLGDAPPLPKIL
jgi:hypothetical protein